jgi:hypothetical protein
VRVEDSPSPVYGAALLMRLGFTALRGSNPRSSAVLTWESAQEPQAPIVVLTANVVTRLQLPRVTVVRAWQELHLLELLVVTEIPWGESVRWACSLADDVSTTALKKLTGNVTSP